MPKTDLNSKGETHGYLNIYKSGRYHRAGKPGAYDRHGGDIYARLDDAIAAIDPPEYYITTIPVVWTDAERPFPNPHYSVPRKLDRRPAPLPDDSLPGWIG